MSAEWSVDPAPRLPAAQAHVEFQPALAVKSFNHKPAFVTGCQVTGRPGHWYVSKTYAVAAKKDGTAGRSAASVWGGDVGNLVDRMPDLKSAIDASLRDQLRTAARGAA